MVTGLHLHSAFQHHHGTPERFTVASHSLAPRPRRRTGTERGFKPPTFRPSANPAPPPGRRSPNQSHWNRKIIVTQVHLMRNQKLRNVPPVVAKLDSTLCRVCAVGSDCELDGNNGRRRQWLDGRTRGTRNLTSESGRASASRNFSCWNPRERGPSCSLVHRSKQDKAPT